ncbi:MAG: hypothetical protein R3E08_07990 [Thiotrichaceae bacterium]
MTQTEVEVEDDRFDLQAGDKFILVVEDDRKFSTILMELKAVRKISKCILAGRWQDCIATC